MASLRPVSFTTTLLTEPKTKVCSSSWIIEAPYTDDSLGSTRDRSQAGTTKACGASCSRAPLLLIEQIANNIAPSRVRVLVMGAGKTKRVWLESDTEAAIAAIRDCRARTGRLPMNAPIHSPPYRAITRLRKEIDRLALVLTGEADIFMSPPPKTSSMGLIKPPKAD